MIRLPAGALLIIGLTASSVYAQRPAPICEDRVERGDRDHIVLDADGNESIIPYRLFASPPTTNTVYALAKDEATQRLTVRPIWAPPQRLPVSVALPKQGGFIDTDPDTTTLYELLAAAVLEAAPTRRVPDAAAVLMLRVDDLSAATAERNSLLLGTVTMRVHALEARCVAGDFVYMATQSYARELRQLCRTPKGCATNIAESVAHWIQQNFGLTYGR